MITTVNLFFKSSGHQLAKYLQISPKDKKFFWDLWSIDCCTSPVSEES